MKGSAEKIAELDRATEYADRMAAQVEAEIELFRPLSEVLKSVKGTQWLVHPLVEQNSLSIWYGDSGTLKTFCVIDLGLCVAHGIPFHRHNTQQGAVFCIFGEGQGGIGKRMAAWHLDKQIEKDAPFYTSSIPAKLSDEERAERISQAVMALADQHQVKPILIIVDTLSANMGDGDESSNSDVAKFLNNLNTYLRAPFGAAVLVVHHVGHGDKSRERGAYAIRGNTDCRVLIERAGDGVITLKCQKMKDAEEWEPFSLRSKVVDLPGVLDSEGDQERSLVLEENQYVEVTANGKHAPKQQALLDLLLTLYEEHSERIKVGKLPSKARVSYGELREEAAKRDIIKDRSNFAKQIKSLKRKNAIYEENGFLFPSDSEVVGPW